MLLFGIAGRARNGKTTFAEALEGLGEKAGMTPVVYDIGQMILNHCKSQGLIAGELRREELSPAQIQILVRVGGEKRALDPNYWTHGIEREHSRLVMRETPRGPHFLGIIPNMRFDSEHRLVKRLGGQTVLVTARNEDGSPYISHDRDPNDPSETGMLHLNADFYITVKRGQPELLRRMAEVIFNHRNIDRNTYPTSRGARAALSLTETL